MTSATQQSADIDVSGLNDSTLTVTVTLTDARDDHFIAQIQDISASGMFVATPKIHPVGREASFEFILPGDPSPFCGLAEISRHAKPDVDTARGMGFRFISFDNGRAHEFVDCLNRMAK